MDEKRYLQESLRKIISKIFKNLLKKIAENALFLHILKKQLTNPAFNLCGFGRETLFIVNFEKLSKFFQNPS